MLVSCPMTAAAASSFWSEIVGDGDCPCDCPWGRACGWFSGGFWACVPGDRSRQPTLNMAAARGCDRRVPLAWCSVERIRYLHFRGVLRQPGRIARFRADGRSKVRYSTRRMSGHQDDTSPMDVSATDPGTLSHDSLEMFD